MKLESIPKRVLFEATIADIYKNWMNKYNKRSWQKEITRTQEKISSTKKKIVDESNAVARQRMSKIVTLLNTRLDLARKIVSHNELAHKEGTWRKDDQVAWKMITRVDQIDNNIAHLKKQFT